MTLYSFFFQVQILVLGLALAKIANDAHRLIVARSRIAWAIEPFLGALYLIGIILFLILKSWMQRDIVVLTGFYVLIETARFLALYLAAALILPDFEERGEAIDLKEYYYENRAPLYLILFIGSLLFLPTDIERGIVDIGYIVIIGGFMCLYALLAWKPWRWLHIPALIFFAGSQFFGVLSFRISEVL